MAYNDLLNKLSNLLYADTGVRTTVSSFVYNGVISYMIFKGVVLPKMVQVTGGANTLTVENKTVLLYNNTSFNAGSPIQNTEIFVSCRALKQSDSENIAKAVVNACNNVKLTGAYYICRIQPVIPPLDVNDNFNTIVSVTAKGA